MSRGLYKISKKKNVKKGGKNKKATKKAQAMSGKVSDCQRRSLRVMAKAAQNVTSQPCNVKEKEGTPKIISEKDDGFIEVKRSKSRKPSTKNNTSAGTENRPSNVAHRKYNARKEDIDGTETCSDSRIIPDDEYELYEELQKNKSHKPSTKNNASADTENRPSNFAHTKYNARKEDIDETGTSDDLESIPVDDVDEYEDQDLYFSRDVQEENEKLHNRLYYLKKNNKNLKLQLNKQKERVKQLKELLNEEKQLRFHPFQKTNSNVYQHKYRSRKYGFHHNSQGQHARVAYHQPQISYEKPAFENNYNVPKKIYVEPAFINSQGQHPTRVYYNSQIEKPAFNTLYDVPEKNYNQFDVSGKGQTSNFSNIGFRRSSYYYTN